MKDQDAFNVTLGTRQVVGAGLCVVLRKVAIGATFSKSTKRHRYPPTWRLSVSRIKVGDPCPPENRPNRAALLSFPCKRCFK